MLHQTRNLRSGQIQKKNELEKKLNMKKKTMKKMMKLMMGKRANQVIIMSTGWRIQRK